MDKWRLIVTEPTSGAMNMAIDEAIMMAVNQKLVPPTIRFYQWSAPTITLGYFQSLAKEVDVTACEQSGIDVVRRLTGGRAVLHYGEFTYSLVAPENNQKVAGSVLQSYLAISRGLVAAIREIGIAAELTEGNKTKNHSAACFDAPSWYELVVQGKKLVGSAQTRRMDCLLQHGSIPLELHAEMLFCGLKFKNQAVRKRAEQIFSAKATALGEVLGYLPNFDDLAKAFVKGFEKGLSIELVQEQLLGQELAWAEELYNNKYSTKEWNGRK